MGDTQGGFDMEQYKYEQDEAAAIGGVMPDSWTGHGRMMIHERGFSGDRRDFAERLLDRLKEKYPDTDAERLAEKAIEKTNEKLD